MVALRFEVDDRANATYASGQIQWKGSWVFNEESRSVTLDGSWGKEKGPYPVLYDDGTHGDRVAGDHIHGVTVFAPKPDAGKPPIMFEYGAVNEFGHWVWEGQNGRVEVAADAPTEIVAPGLTLQPFGARDLRIILNTVHLHADYKSLSFPDTSVFLKGSMNSWKPVQLLDHGQKGDAKPGDGVYTYVHSLNLGAHDGLLYDGQHVQFVFVFHDPEGLEYKDGPKTLADGIQVELAAARASADSRWTPAGIALEKESRGRAMNTTVVVPTAWNGGPVTESPTLELWFVRPARGSIAGGTEVVLTGQGFVAPLEVWFGEAKAHDVRLEDAETIHLKTPAHAEGQTDVKVALPGGAHATYRAAYLYVDAPDTPAQPPPLVTWGNIQHPPEIRVRAGEESDYVYGRVYVAGMTEGVGMGRGLQAEVGMGPVDTLPSAQSWTWFAAAYFADRDSAKERVDEGNRHNDEFRGRILAPTAGAMASSSSSPQVQGERIFHVAYRYRLGAGPWLIADLSGSTPADPYQPASAAKLVVTR